MAILNRKTVAENKAKHLYAIKEYSVSHELKDEILLLTEAVKEMSNALEKIKKDGTSIYYSKVYRQGDLRRVKHCVAEESLNRVWGKK